MSRFRAALVGWIKRRLDRRYATSEQVEEIRAGVADLRLQVEYLATELGRFGTSLAATQDQAGIGSSFVGKENPTELRKRLFAAHRLANESADAIETLLQQELLIRRDVDMLGGSPNRS